MGGNHSRHDVDSQATPPPSLGQPVASTAAAPSAAIWHWRQRGVQKPLSGPFFRFIWTSAGARLGLCRARTQQTRPQPQSASTHATSAHLVSRLQTPARCFCCGGIQIATRRRCPSSAPETIGSDLCLRVSSRGLLADTLAPAAETTFGIS